MSAQPPSMWDADESTRMTLIATKASANAAGLHRIERAILGDTPRTPRDLPLFARKR